MSIRPSNFARLVEQLVPLVAELFATLAARDPLRMRFADIANKTLLDMVMTLESQGMSQEAMAASLGLTIGGFRNRMKRLREMDDDTAGPAGPRTLLERVFSEVGNRETAGKVATYMALRDRFKGVKDDSLGGVLHFLVTTGLLSVTGRGPKREYRVVPHNRPSGPRYTDAVVLLYREGPISLLELATRLEVTTEQAQRFVDRVKSAGYLEESVGPDGAPRYRSNDYHVPIDDKEGFEAALYDHLSSVVRAVTKKVRLGRLRASMNDLVGGSTFSFEIEPDDPLYAEVTSFLGETRSKLDGWLQRSRALAASRDPAAPKRPRHRITVYFGQTIDEDRG